MIQCQNYSENLGWDKLKSLGAETSGDVATCNGNITRPIKAMNSHVWSDHSLNSTFFVLPRILSQRLLVRRAVRSAYLLALLNPGRNFPVLGGTSARNTPQPVVLTLGAIPTCPPTAHRDTRTKKFHSCTLSGNSFLARRLTLALSRRGKLFLSFFYHRRKDVSGKRGGRRESVSLVSEFFFKSRPFDFRKCFNSLL